MGRLRSGDRWEKLAVVRVAEAWGGESGGEGEREGEGCVGATG